MRGTRSGADPSDTLWAVDEALLRAWPSAARWPPEALAAARERCTEAFEEGARQHPGIEGDPILFMEGLGRRLATHEPLDWQDAEAGLDAIDAAGLFLATACAAGQASAIARFEALYFKHLPTTLRSMGAQVADIDDVIAIVREKLFVAEAGQRPRVLDVAGRGSLDKLCRVIAARTLLNRRRSTRRQRVTGDEQLADLIAPHDDPELAAMKDHHRDVFRAALGEALGNLTSEDRNLLRLALIYRLSIDEVGRIQQIHRSTAARRLGRLKSAIAQDTRMYLRLKLGADRRELASLFRLVETGLGKSFVRLLGADASTT